jgi:hypothetical protein
MPKLLCMAVLIAACAHAQSGVTATSNDDLFPPHRPSRKVGLVRGVVKQLDPIYDQLTIHTFGGGDIRVDFGPQTKFTTGKATLPVPGIPAGSVVSVDTVIEDGKLFAESVTTDPPRLAELHGQVVKFDTTRSRLMLRDPISPEAVSLRIAPSTTVVDRGRTVPPETLAPGMLVRVWRSVGQDAAKEVEILARPGASFTFEGRIIAVDLRSRVLSLTNDTDHSLRELVLGPLDSSTLALLREGNLVAIQAEFDGERYNVRTITLLPHHP